MEKDKGSVWYIENIDWTKTIQNQTGQIIVLSCIWCALD